MTRFDELNKLFKGYFDVMDISQEDKRKRVDCAFFFYDAVWYVLTMIRLEHEKDRLQDAETYIRSLEYRIKDSLGEIPYDDEYVSKFSQEVIETTFRHLDDEEEQPSIQTSKTDKKEENYFLSENRAILIAQNEANTVMNSADFITAKNNGLKYKRWIAELDNRTRPWHEIMNGVMIPIDEMFEVGTDLMRFPHDYTASAENVVNCRCSCVYT